MFASSSGSLAKRRGIVLVVVLGMLGLMALIGVTFATFAGQSLIATRNFNQGVARPQAEVLMDYALAQLINDTNNPASAIRGHSLLRDMYGNDSVFRGSNPTANPAAETGGILTSVYNAGTGTYVAPQMTLLGVRSTSATSPSPTPFYNQIQFQTNIPTSGQYYGLDFTRWIVKIQGSPANAGSTALSNIPSSGFAAQTFEILEDDSTSSQFHKFTFSNNLTNPTIDLRYPGTNQPLVPGDWATFLYVDPNYISSNSAYGVVPFNMPGPYQFIKATASLAEEWIPNITFTLDGRNMRAFNGPGLTQYVASINNIAVPYPYNLAALANFRINGFNPDAQGMDEDYDACDLENWFLALQSADGQVVVPSFHRPGILMAADWTVGASIAQVSKILRPRQIDNSPLFPADPSVPDPVSGKLSYDIDNDGDGVTDSVWLDLGYSVQRDPGGKLYKPLFAFMVIGLNGRLPLNTVGNLHARANSDTTNNAYAGVFTSSMALPISYATGQVPYPGLTGDTTNVPPAYKPMQYNAFFGSTYSSSQTYFDAPLYDHASHLGFSVNEINPKFALQNAPSNVYASSTSANGTAITTNVNGNNYSQVDNAGVSVALTQLRNILAGTIPTDLPYPYTGGVPLGVNASANHDANIVMVNGQYMVLPNNMADLNDINGFGTTPFPVVRNLPPVAGRWGEPSGILQNSLMPASGSTLPTASPVVSYPGLIYNNPVRAGRSIYVNGTNDAMDDDFDSTDPVLASYAAAMMYYNEPTLTGSAPVQVPSSGIARNLPEFADTFDTIGQRAVASERIRQFVTPIDPGGIGRVVDFMNRPNNDYDYGRGFDNRGRTSFFRYFRTPGMPQDIRYPYGGVGSSYPSYPGVSGVVYNPSPVYTNTGTLVSTGGHRYLMPQLYPAGSLYAYYNPPPTANTSPAGTVSSAGVKTGASDIHSNRLHGFQSMLTPEYVAPGTSGVSIQQIASMGAMPYDWDNSLPPSPYGPGGPGIPGGYPNSVGPVSTTLPPMATTFPTGPPLTYSAIGPQTYINTFAPTINPNSLLTTSVNTSYGPNFGLNGNPGQMTVTPGLAIGYGNYQSATDYQPILSPVVNGYLGGGLNKDEADEMNLYTPNRYDMPYGPSDLEWLYRLQDIDGATLSSRLSKLAPVSFLNPADGLTRRRLFSTDSWEPTGWVYANDNPSPYAGVAYGVSTDHTFAYNSRFTPTASPTLENMNQIDGVVTFPSGTYSGIPTYSGNMANPITTEYLPNPTFPTISGSQTTSFGEVYPNSSYTGAVVLPAALDTGSTNLFDQSTTYLPVVSTGAGVVVNYGANSMVQVQTPSLAHRDRKINLNIPLPISNDPGEPVRQKWCRETYTLLKAILPPSSVDTPEELAALSQFVVNIIDFRDTDCTTTRFVNTDLIVTDVLTKTASPIMPTTIPASFPMNSYGYDTTWNVSPSGVRFANSGDKGLLTSFPYDPSLYTPDATCPFLVQHGMEYNPIAINEAMAFQYQYVNTSTPTAQFKDTANGLILELTNTLTEEQNNNGSPNNASAINLSGWDLVLTPDNFGWGRPDSVTGEVNPIALPPVILPDPAMPTPPMYNPFRTAPTLGTAPTTVQPNPFLNVKQYQFTAGGTTLNAINGSTGPVATLAGLYTYKSTVGGATTAHTTAPTGAESGNKIIQSGSISFTLPTYMLPTPPPPGSGTGLYYWVYLRRPANPFDTANLGTDNPAVVPAGPQYNREMVVVDAIRVPYMDGGGGTMAFTPPVPPSVTGTATMSSPGTFSEMYSTRRLQPYRGGHLLRVNSTAGPLPPATAFGATTDANGNNILANGVNAICPPSPANAYGYSEQAAPASGTSGHAQYQPVTGGPSTQLSGNYRETIGMLAGVPSDTSWSHFPFNDRDFTSVAELLLVPGCPPGLFTKQFVEEPYPGNTVAQQFTTTITLPAPPATGAPTAATTVQYGAAIMPTPPTLLYATGSDNTDLATAPVKAPVVVTMAPTPTTAAGVTTITTVTSPVGGRQNFGTITVTNYTVPMPGSGTIQITPTPVAETFPYLPDNFYYTAASVAPPTTGTPPKYPSYYTHLTTEIGGWTGAGWHKMLEFFEVPSSANGAIGTADGGFNFDWARQDIKPGLLNLNLIIDEEVFAGLFDDPRLNERLAAYAPAGGSSTIPHIVTQIDGNGYAASHYPISSLVSTNQLNFPLDGSYYLNGNNNPTLMTTSPGGVNFGRGYVVRDPDSQNYIYNPNQVIFPYQQLHGLKAAFSDFLKLRHGGSGYLFAHGAGPTGSGDLAPGAWKVTQPIAAERPYRSLSYPDINYTVMRPASLPPSLPDLANLPNSYRWTATTPSLTASMANLFSYGINTPGSTGNVNNYVELLQPVAPMNLTLEGTGTSYQYVADPGVKNPYSSVQYLNQAVPNTGSTVMDGPPTLGLGGPPYPVLPFPTLFAAYLANTQPYNPFAVAPATPVPAPFQAAPFPPPIPPTPARRLIQIPDIDTSGATGTYSDTNTPPNIYLFPAPDYPSSNATVAGQVDGTTPGLPEQDGLNIPFTPPTYYSVNSPAKTLMTYTGVNAPPSLVAPSRSVFYPDNNTPNGSTTYAPSPINMNTAPAYPAAASNYLGAGRNPSGTVTVGGTAYATAQPTTNDQRQHPLYQTEWLQKIMNLSTVRTHQFAVWITVGFFEVVKVGTPELGVPDVLGQELGLTAGKSTRYRSFFTLDRTKATGFNPYFPGNFRDCVTYRRRIE